MTKVSKVYDQIADEISTGARLPGQKLPSLRAAMVEFAVSKNTVVDAYDRLGASGLVESVPGSGFYVASHTAKLINRSLKPSHVTEAVDRISLLNAQLHQGSMVRVGDGRPPAGWMSLAIPSSLRTRVFRDVDLDQTGYGSAYGNATLRQMIEIRHRRADQPVSVDQIVTTFGANHALDLIIRRYLSAGDVVLVDDPGYYPLVAKLKLAQIGIVGVPRTPSGPDVEALVALARQYSPKMFFTQSTCQNPTGTSMTLPTAHSILQSALQFGMLVIDNDPFFDLPGKSKISLATLDQFSNVVAISSYSKLLSASFRVGYLIAPPKIAKEIAELKLVTAVNSSRFSEILISEMISGQRYQRHLNALAKRLGPTRADYNAKIKKLGLNSFDDGAGYYSFLMLPEGTNETHIASAAQDKGIFLAPGSLFWVDGENKPPALRVNITRADDARFFRFLKDYFT